MPQPRDVTLYNAARRYVDTIYAHPSAYKSGAIVKRYKSEFAKKYGEKAEPYVDDGRAKNLQRWYREGWTNVNDMLGKTDPHAYPLYRPTKRINSHTPLTVSEISPKNLMQQYTLKQKIRGGKNLPPFQEK